MNSWTSPHYPYLLCKYEFKIIESSKVRAFNLFCMVYRISWRDSRSAHMCLYIITYYNLFILNFFMSDLLNWFQLIWYVCISTDSENILKIANALDTCPVRRVNKKKKKKVNKVYDFNNFPPKWNGCCSMSYGALTHYILKKGSHSRIY